MTTALYIPTAASKKYTRQGQSLHTHNTTFFGFFLFSFVLYLCLSTARQSLIDLSGLDIVSLSPPSTTLGPNSWFVHNDFKTLSPTKCLDPC